MPITQDAYTNIYSFGGEAAKCDKLNELLCQKAGFSACYVG